jgi:hypothetical protein
VRLLPLSLLLTLAACSEERHSIIIDVRTDYVPGLEFDVATAVLDGGPERVSDAVVGDDFAGGVRLAEYDEIASGNHELVVDLVDSAGEVLAQRRVRVEVVEDIAMTVVITRSCEGVRCPQSDPEATTCLGGVCVNPRCSEIDPSSCPASCSSDGECMVAAACAIGRCVEGACLSAPDDGSCGAGEVCLPTTGCVPAEGGSGFARDIRITNEASVPMPVGYTIRVGLGAVDPISARVDLADVRVLTADMPTTDSGLRRVVDADAPVERAVYFPLTAEIPVGAMATYRLHYGDESVAPPAEDPASVFGLHDGFEGAELDSRWSAFGAPSVSGVLTLGTGDVAVTTEPAADGVGPVSVFEAEMTTTDAAAPGTYYWVGYQHLGDFGTGAPFLNWVGRSGVIYPWVSVPSTIMMCADIAADDETHRYRIERTPGSTRYFRDGVMACEIEVDDAVDYAIQLRNQSTTAVVEIDWVRVRDIVSPQPTVVIGPEESL